MPWPYDIVACSIGFQRLVRAQPPDDLAREAGLRRRAEADLAKACCHIVSARQRQRDLRRADVGRFLDHLRRP